MGRKLTTTTLVDGVVYDAGTDEADIRGVETVTADVWDGDADPVEPFDPEVGGTVEATLLYVGQDKAKAVAMLKFEQGTDKPRTTLVEKLEAIATKPESR